MRGKFITFEGGEGVGKSTFSRKLAERFRALHIETMLTREPGGSPGAEEIRALLVKGANNRWDGITECLLHSAARRDHVIKSLLPALEDGKWVICDRFFDSTLVYQGYGLGVSLDWIKSLGAVVAEDLTPDLTLVFDAPVEIGLARTKRRNEGEDRYENQSYDFHQRIREGFLKIAKENPERCRLLDATQPFDVVWQEILKFVGEYFSLALNSDEMMKL